ncbi:Phosphoacetylglucosamine Mutase [Tulasnella sp. JGI-2019a]|nr:Phosphoacetylglucosamine Mutase [Tulasnella sp. JGI-2019a]KAG9008899.1 Phosphoacetylglucosamine Mutase [Tulasnella sp. JGI-2019a]
MSVKELFGENLAHFGALHPKPTHIKFQYGTAGFRTVGNTLDSVMFRMGVLAAIRSKRLESRTIGVMVTASHNPEADNGIKLVDPRGEMLEQAWEVYATQLANAPTTDDFIDILQALVNTLKIDLKRPSHVLYGRDTRPSGPTLIQALEDGIKAIGAIGRNAGVVTTPVLHYLVRCVNTKGTKEEYGDDSEEGYYRKMSTAFKNLVTGKEKPTPLVVDCANGVGATMLERFAPYVKDLIKFVPMNTDLTTPGALNYQAGADYVKTLQRIPPGLQGHVLPGQRAASFDGDADRLMYYYVDNQGSFRMLDGDKIAALVAGFIVELVKGAALQDQIEVGIVQTAYANGASTKYLSQRVPIKCVPTGVKHLHHAAEGFGIGVYFEANGHGTVLFSPETLDLLSKHEPKSPAQQTCIQNLIELTRLINQAVGDALSDMLLVEVILSHKRYGPLEWDSSYTDLPNRLVKVLVKDKGRYKTTDAERKLSEPEGLQARIDEQVQKYEGGRSFVRASGTEDAVRVYAEASARKACDDLAFKVAGIVYDEAGGAPRDRPVEFL